MSNLRNSLNSLLDSIWTQTAFSPMASQESGDLHFPIQTSKGATQILESVGISGRGGQRGQAIGVVCHARVDTTRRWPGVPSYRARPRRRLSVPTRYGPASSPFHTAVAQGPACSCCAVRHDRLPPLCPTMHPLGFYFSRRLLGPGPLFCSALGELNPWIDLRFSTIMTKEPLDLVLNNEMCELFVKLSSGPLVSSCSEKYKVVAKKEKKYQYF